MHVHTNYNSFSLALSSTLPVYHILCPHGLDIARSQRMQKHVSRHTWIIGCPWALYRTLTDCKRTHSTIISPDMSYSGVQEGYSAKKLFLNQKVCPGRAYTDPSGHETEHATGCVGCISHSLAFPAQIVLEKKRGVGLTHTRWSGMTYCLWVVLPNQMVTENISTLSITPS